MDAVGKVLRLPLTYPKTSLFAVAVPALIYLFYKAKDLLKIVQIVTSLKSALPTDTLDLMRKSRDRDGIYERLKRTFAVYTTVKLPITLRLKDQMKHAPSREDRLQFWIQFKSEVFAQAFFNVYACEVYKCAFLVSTHLIARLEVEGQNTTGLADMFEREHKQIRHNEALHSFILAKVTPVLDRYDITHLTTLGDVESIMEACQAAIETVVRPPAGARFEVLDCALPKECGDTLAKRNVYSLFLQYFFDRETQEEVMRRAGALVQRVTASIQDKIHSDGKNNPNRHSLFDWKGLELAHILTHLDKQDITCVWEPNEALGRRVFYEL